MTPAQIASKLTKAQREALSFDERTYLEACQLNALELVHMDVVKGADGTLVDLRSHLTPLGKDVRAAILASEGEG